MKRNFTENKKCQCSDLLGEMANLMKNFGQIQNNMKKMQQELASVEVRGTSYSNIAEVVMSGDMIVKSVKLDPAALAVQNRELVENAVKEAIASALQQVKMEGAKRLSDATGGLNIPGLTPGA